MEKLIQLSFIGGENLLSRGWARNGFCHSGCLISILHPYCLLVTSIQAASVPGSLAFPVLSHHFPSFPDLTSLSLMPRNVSMCSLPRCLNQTKWWALFGASHPGRDGLATICIPKWPYLWPSGSISIVQMMDSPSQTATCHQVFSGCRRCAFGGKMAWL